MNDVRMTEHVSQPRRIAGRYAVEGELATGGMGAVYKVREERTNRVLALKRLLPSPRRNNEALFRREYHTLVLLKHPGIVGVHDYGLDGDEPYYTMELLDGDDLRILSPLAFREACRHLIDVASALGLLAAHRLVHRDLSARNVRVTRDGRCKLIDFGAVSPFGVAEALVGTAPYVPPEAVRGLPLDQRSDLFSLGALAYFLLTGTHAFAARSFSELENAWKSRPAGPSVRVLELIEQGAGLEPLPRALDDLVLSLLAFDPLARPQNAAEVIDRLGAVSGLVPDLGPPAAQSYVLSAAHVGRSGELLRIRSLIADAVAGKGALLSIRHAAGMGGSRLLNEIGVEARLSGATVLHVDAEAVRGPLGVLRALVEKLGAALPAEARAGAPAELIGWLRSHPSDRPAGRAGQGDVATAPLAMRLALQDAMEKWFLTVAASHPLAILVDGAHEVDEPSAAFLSCLAAVAAEHALLLVIALRVNDQVATPALLAKLAATGEVTTLEPLPAEDTAALLRSVFGHAPNLDRLAHTVHGLCGGNPLHVMEMAQHLVASGAARYVEGRWALPQELPPGAPSRMEEVEERRLARLQPRTLGLASEWAVHEGHLSLELCMALADAEPGAGFIALDELTSAGILVGRGNGYQFARKSMRAKLLARLDPAEQKLVHLRLGEFLARVPDAELTTALDAGWHLFLGGEERRGAELLRRVGLELVQADELPEAIPVLEAAARVYRKLDRPRNELCGLVHPLAFAGYYVDYRLADEYGEEALRLLTEETGLALTVRLRPYVGTYLGLMVGLSYATILHFFGGRGGVRALSALVSILGGLSTALVGTSIICLDKERAVQRAAVLQPFEAFGLWHAGAFCHAMAKKLVALTEDHAGATIEGLRQLLVRLDSPRGVLGFPEQMRPLTRGGLLYALGALEGFQDEPVALERANQLESCGLRLYDMVAFQIRANYHACRGEAALAREYERQVELHAIRNGSTWQAEVWAPLSHLNASKLTHDLMGMKRAAEELERLTERIPTLARYARLGRAALTMMRGDAETAIPALHALCTETAPRAFVGWTIAASALAEAYNQTGQHERAETLCKEVCAGLTELDRRLVALYLGIEIQLALAEAGLGRPADAARRLDALIATHAENRGPVTLGSLHRARTLVAHGQGDLDTARDHHRQMESWFRSTKNPALVAECERLTSLLWPGSAAASVASVDTATVREGGSSDARSEPNESRERVLAASPSGASTPPPRRRPTG